MRTAAIASSIEYVPAPVGSSVVPAAKKLFCISLFGVGCSPASILQVADLLAAAGNAEGAAEFVNFAYKLFDREYNECLSIIEDTFSDEIRIPRERQ